jgi:hypothetical protein
MMFTFSRHAVRCSRLISKLLLISLLAAPVAAQRQTAPARPPAQTPASEQPPTFDELLATDSFKLYGEVRNVGQLLSNGGAGEIVDPIIKLADPGPQFKTMISFLKKNSEALAQSRLMLAAWPVRTDLPNAFVAIEFPTNEEAAKFYPKLETFLPTVLPPVPVTPEPSPEKEGTNDLRVRDPKVEVKPGEPSLTATVMVKDQAANAQFGPAPSPPTQPGQETPKPLRNPRTEGQKVIEQSTAAPQAEERLPFVITHAGNLVCISDKSFKFSKLRPKDSHPLFRDQSFRTARDQFSSEPIFFFFNVALEDKTKPSPTPPPVITAEEAARIKAEEDEAAAEALKNRAEVAQPSPEISVEDRRTAVLVAGPTISPSPTPTPTKEEQAQRIASNQIGQMLESIGYGEPQWPDAVGMAVALEGNEYIVRALMIDKPEAKKTPIPFVPQLIGGPAFTSGAASVLPDDTDVLVSASIDLVQTFDGMRKAEEKKRKEDMKPRSQTYVNGVLVAQGRPRSDSPDVFATFEKNAKLNIKDDLLPAFGHEIAIAGSLKTLNAAGMGVMGMPGMPTPKSSDNDKEGEAKKEPKLPVLLIEVTNRDAARPLMPRILTGLGIGEANLVAQTEKRGDTETVNYAGIFAYAFVGDFVVISDAIGVRKVVDAYLNHQTLSSNTVFRNSRRWQSSRTTGQVYVSPTMMEGYQDQIRKSSASMDGGLRDFLLGLDPNAEAITYALADDGMGTRHELHLPKNYILMMVASVSSITKTPPPEMNEAVAGGVLSVIASMENQYKAGPGKGSYASYQQLVDAKMLTPGQFDKYGYKFDIAASGDSFEATATPNEYGKTGKRSFFVDKTGVVRGDDHGGAPATVADKPIQQ